MSASRPAAEQSELGLRGWIALEVLVWVAVGVFAAADELLMLATFADILGSRLASFAS